MYEVPFEMPCPFHSIAVYFYGLFLHWLTVHTLAFEGVVLVWKCKSMQLLNNGTSSGQSQGLTHVFLSGGPGQYFQRNNSEKFYSNNTPIQRILSGLMGARGL